MLRIAVLVSGGGTNLQALIDAKNSGGIENGELVLVLSSKADVGALERAWKNSIATETVARKNYKDIDDFSQAMLEVLERYSIDLVVLAGFLSITSDSFVKAYRNRIINVHPALIPSFSGQGFYGMHVHRAALERGVKLTGATVHFVNEQCDGGPIILQKAVEVLEGDSPESLQKRVMEQAEWELLPKAVSLFCDGRLTVDDEGLVHVS